MKILIKASSMFENSLCSDDDFCGCYAAGDYDGDGCDCVDLSL